MANDLFKSHVTALRKVRDALTMSLKMNGTQLILGAYNEACRKNALDKVNEALSYLNSTIK
jgi:hypothetical protein